MTMDLVTSCKEKLAHFRIRELKGILTQLSLSKQGKKQDLIDRILAILSDERVSGIWSKRNAVGKEEVAKLVDDIYRKLQDSGTTEFARGRGIFDSNNNNNTKHEDEVDVPLQVEKVRCLCGSTLKADSTIKCEDPRCNVWQHIACVIIPEKPTDGILPVPPTNFYCELCRLTRADPFWVTVSHLLVPVKLVIANVPTDGTNPMQSIEKTFQLTRADRDMLVKPEYDVQAWCMLLNDKVAFRLQWPQYAELQINGVPMRVISRPGSQLLGANGRDDGSIITTCTRDGINKITITGCDLRVFCVGVRIVKRRTVQQILNYIPKESDGERFEDALARVRRCAGGGPATDNADSDSDLEVVADNITVSLRCPMSGSRMKIAGRFKPCVHMGCFDLEIFVEMTQRSRKWQCPICLKNYSLENIIIDPYFTRITSKMLSCGDDVTEIEVKPDGSWRAKSEDDRKSLGDLGQWHLPDGTICSPAEVESKPKLEALKQVELQGGYEGHSSGLKLGINKNKNGILEVRKLENRHSVSFCSKLPIDILNGHNTVPMSSSGTVSGRDGEDTSVNGGGRFDYPTPNNGLELDSLSLNIDRNFTGSAGGDAEVIVLSDSEDENENLIPSGQVYNNINNNLNPDGEGAPFTSLPVPHPELGLFNTNDVDFGGSFWSLQSGNPCGPGFQFVGSDPDPTNGLVDLHHSQLGSTSMGVGGYDTFPGSSDPGTMNTNNGLIDNSLAFGGDDPSLQLFLPSRPPSEATQQVDFTSQPPAVSNGFRDDDWISLSLGGSSSGAPSEAADVTAAATGWLNPRQKPPPTDGRLDTLADTASLLLGMSEGRSGKVSRERSNSPFSFPRQKRSVRPRPYLSIDTDSGEDI
ncbi:E3 SUMO-protein ligase SIZ1-like isoform X2 [Bidens hawaiensis]|uniref:E3 SUMO-protein ligase SIZ1-like isoform X2 n=2 Tax=Bidens hawaiensis TaxID=980011 RepID=UPI00404A94ED